MAFINEFAEWEADKIVFTEEYRASIEAWFREHYAEFVHPFNGFVWIGEAVAHFMDQAGLRRPDLQLYNAIYAVILRICQEEGW